MLTQNEKLQMLRDAKTAEVTAKNAAQEAIRTGVKLEALIAQAEAAWQAHQQAYVRYEFVDGRYSKATERADKAYMATQREYVRVSGLLADALRKAR